MTASRAAFLRLLDDPDIVIYGVTSGYGQRARLRFDREQRRRHAAQPPYSAAVSFGEPLPERAARAIVLARLTNFIEGHAAITPALAQAVADLLDGGALPVVPTQGNGGAGEILALSQLFSPLAARVELGEKDALGLINGSPCAAALVADAAIVGLRRLAVIEAIFALAFEAIAAPLEHIDPALDDLWGEVDEAGALRSLRRLLAEGRNSDRRPYQAPVSFRILPRMLGRLRRALRQARRAAMVSLQAVTDNPVFVAADADWNESRVCSNGGYHNTIAWPAMDELAAVYADLCTLTERHAAKILSGSVSLLPDQLLDAPDDPRYMGSLPMAQVGFAEEARRAAQRTFLPGSESGGFGQNDVATPHFFAWQAQARAGAMLEASLACLGLVASQAFYTTQAAVPPALAPRLAAIRESAPPLIDTIRPLGPEAEVLAQAFRNEIFAPVSATGVPELD
jgi:histidine ammonia-lyase